MATKLEWFWSEEALNYWDVRDEEISAIINEKAEEFLQEHSRDTVTKEDMEEILRRVYMKLSKKDRKDE